MRDPDASIAFEPEQVVRRLRSGLEPDHFLSSATARQWLDQRRLVPFEVIDPFTVVAPRIPLVTYPFEWCDAQLFDAAEFTLQLQRDAVRAGFDLKDASAWNVLFVEGRPIFCDLLSFEPLRQRLWWAGGQFGRHFVLPLLLARTRGLNAHQSFRAWRDGVPSSVARGMLGWQRYLTRYWPLMADSTKDELAPQSPTAQDLHASVTVESIVTFRSGLETSLQWMLDGVRPSIDERPASASWSSYVNDRHQYDEDSLRRKQSAIAEWLTVAAPRWVGDFGSNTGEFSKLALERGAAVVAIDADHDSVQRLYRSLPTAANLHAVVAPLDDLDGGRGWHGSEFPGLATRLAQRFDLVMMLALVHHLMVSASIPVDEIASFAAQCTRRWLIVELIQEDDVQMQSLCRNRRRDARDFGISVQRKAFVDAGFVTEAEVDLAPTRRSLLLLRRSEVRGG